MVTAGRHTLIVSCDGDGAALANISECVSFFLLRQDGSGGTLVTWKDLHDNVGYTPYEGRQIKGWPITVVSRGRVVVEDGKLNAERGSGQFLPCASPDSSKPIGQSAPELQAMSRFGLKPLF